jgi:hypothetical protein
MTETNLIGDKEHCVICDERFTEEENISPTLTYELYNFFEGYQCFVHLNCVHFIHSVTHCGKSFFEQAPKTRETALSIINKAHDTRWKNITQQKTIDYLRKFVAFMCDKTLVVLVNGEEYTFSAIGNETALELKHHILYESRNTLRPKEHWELIRQDGTIISDLQILDELNIPKDEKLILSLKFAGGDTFFVSTPHPAHLNKNGDFISKGVRDEAIEKWQKKQNKNLFVNEYLCAPVENISISAHSSRLSNEEVVDSFKKARAADNILSIAYIDDETKCDICGNNIKRQNALSLNYIEYTLNKMHLCTECHSLACYFPLKTEENHIVDALQGSIEWAGRMLILSRSNVVTEYEWREHFVKMKVCILKEIKHEDAMCFTGDHKILTKDGFTKMKDLVSFVTEPADKIYSDECDAKCGRRKLAFEKQSEYVKNFKIESPTFLLHANGKRFCQECLDLISYYPIGSNIETVSKDLTESLSFVNYIIKYYKTFDYDFSIYQARKAFCIARIDGLSPTDIAFEIDARIRNTLLKVVLGKADDQFEKQREQMLENEIMFVKKCQDCGIEVPKLNKCKICDRETHSTHLQYCDECRNLKQFISAKYMRFDEECLDKKLKESLRYSINHPITPRYDAREYFLRQEYSCCVCSSEKDVVIYNEKYPLCVYCATLYECCPKTWTNEKAIQEIKKSLIFAKPEDHEASITFDDRRKWLEKHFDDCFEEYRDPSGNKVFSNAMNFADGNKHCSICDDNLPDSVPMRFALSHSSILLETDCHTKCGEYIKWARDDMELSKKNEASTEKTAREILMAAKKEYFDTKCARTVIKKEKYTGDYFERTKDRKDPISFYNSIAVDNPDSCVICNMACNKEKKIIETPYGFKIACRVHENHLKYIDVNAIGAGSDGKDDYEKGRIIIAAAHYKFEHEFEQWTKRQGNNKEIVIKDRKTEKKKPTNEIKLLGTGDLKIS